MNLKHWMPVLLAAAVLAAPASATRESVPKDWTKLSGSVSGVASWRTVDVRDEATWKKLWNEHTANKIPTPPAPFVDFTRERVIAVFLGARTYGHGVDLEIKKNPGAGIIEVSIKEGKPAKGSGRFAITMMAQPFVFRRESRKIETVVFPKAPGMRPGASVQTTAKKPAAAEKLVASKTIGARKAVAALGEELSGLRDSVASLRKAYDGATVKTAAFSGPAPVNLTGGKPLPGQKEQSGKPLPRGDRDRGKPLPGRQDPKKGKPLPGQGGGGKPLPGQGGGKPLPGGGVSHPRPIYPGGPLPDNDPRLEGAGRTYSTYGMKYVGYWNGKTFYQTSKATLDRDGKNPGSRYSVTLTSRRYKRKYEFWYDPADKEYYWTPDDVPVSGRRTRDLTIVFTNTAQSPLLPWESERFVFALTGSQLSLESQSGAYRYSGTFTTDANDPTLVTAHLSAGAKVLTAPDPKGVSAAIQATANGVKIVVTDKWAVQYAGETLEIAAVVRWDDGKWYRRDPVVFQASSRSPLSFTAAKTVEHEFSTTKRGKFYLESWSFRRAGSAISADRWINRGQGNNVTR
jgi:hypothetical protein